MAKPAKPAIPDVLDIRIDEDRNWLALHSITVYIDGERASRIVAYNLKAGKLTRHAIDEGGRIMVDEAGEYVLETIKANVTAEWS